MNTKPILLQRCKLHLNYMKYRDLKGSDLKDFSPEIRQLVTAEVKPLTPSDEKRLIIAAQKGDKQASHTLFQSNARYIAAAAMYYEPYCEIYLPDLFAIGCEGFVKALNTFDVTKGARLITRMQQVMSDTFQRAINQDDRQSFYHIESYYKEPSNEREDDGSSYASFISSFANNYIYEGSNKYAVHTALYDAIDQLPTREREVLLGHLKGLKYEEIANELGISTSRVGQIHKRAIARLRSPEYSKYFETYLSA